jgi:hypothetical protein
VEALDVARAIHAELDHDLDVTIWNHGLFSPGITTWVQLTQVTRDFDFALFVFSGDDNVQSRGEQSLAVRDNLLIEYGLFVGVLGAERTFFLYNRDHRPKIASDLGGVTPLSYRDRSDRNLQAAISPACNHIRQIANRLGRVHREPLTGLTADKLPSTSLSDPVVTPPRFAADLTAQLAATSPMEAASAAWSTLEEVLESACRRARVTTPATSSHYVVDLAIALEKAGVLSTLTVRPIRGLGHMRHLMETAPKGDVGRTQDDIKRTQEFLAMVGVVTYSVEVDLEKYLKEQPING